MIALQLLGEGDSFLGAVAPDLGWLGQRGSEFAMTFRPKHVI